MEKDSISVVFITKCESRWHKPLFRFLEKAYGNVSTIFLNEEIKSRRLPSSGKPLVDDICCRITEHAPLIVIFDLEFSLLLSPGEVASVCKGLSCPTFGIAMDDDRFHDINREVYAGVDGILTHPLSVERYRLIGYDAFEFFPSFELCRDEGHNLNIDVHDKDIDVLSYGLLKGDRKRVLEQLKNSGVNVYHPPFNTSDAELNNLIRRSKVVINLSSGSPVANNPIQFLPFSKFKQTIFPTRQLKSRIYEVAALGTLCVSEEFAGDNLVFEGDGLITVKDSAEMVEVINNLILDNYYYEAVLVKFLSVFNSRYNLRRRVEEFRKFTDGFNLRRGVRLESGTVINACSLATKCIYSLRPLPLLRFQLDNSSFFKSLTVKVLAFFFILYSLGCVLLKRQ